MGEDFAPGPGYMPPGNGLPDGHQPDRTVPDGAPPSAGPVFTETPFRDLGPNSREDPERVAAIRAAERARPIGSKIGDDPGSAHLPVANGSHATPPRAFQAGPVYRVGQIGPNGKMLGGEGYAEVAQPNAPASAKWRAGDPRNHDLNTQVYPAPGSAVEPSSSPGGGLRNPFSSGSAQRRYRHDRNFGLFGDENR